MGRVSDDLGTAVDRLEADPDRSSIVPDRFFAWVRF